LARSFLLKNFVYSAGGPFVFCNVGKQKKRGASCEHKSLCEYIRNKGYKILIDPASVCTWKRNSDPVENKYMLLRDQLPTRPMQVTGKL
jgi:hypothetical protein